MEQELIGIVFGLIGAFVGVFVTLLVNMVNNSALKAKIEIYDCWKRNARGEERPALERLRKQIVKRITNMTLKDNLAVVLALLALAVICFFAGVISSNYFPRVSVYAVPVVVLAALAIGFIVGRCFLDSEKPKDLKNKSKGR